MSKIYILPRCRKRVQSTTYALWTLADMYEKACPELFGQGAKWETVTDMVTHLVKMGEIIEQGRECEGLNASCNCKIEAEFQAKRSAK